jgi:broad specificity phosphatase PhoE
VIFVRHGLPIVDEDVPTRDWPLDPAHAGEVTALAAVIAELPVVCSDMVRAIETAKFFGEPAIDPRLAEVSRPWVHDDLDADVARYFLGESLNGWEPQAEARARFRAAVDEHGRAVYVTHGTIMTLYLASVVPTLNAMEFWSRLTFPDAWQLEDERLVRLSAAMPREIRRVLRDDADHLVDAQEAAGHPAE